MKKSALMSETNWTANWARRTPITDGPAGYVIAAMRRDPNVPRLFHHIGEMRSYLRLKRAPQKPSPSFRLSGDAIPTGSRKPGGGLRRGRRGKRALQAKPLGSGSYLTDMANGSRASARKG
jgi:hypothetical protein